MEQLELVAETVWSFMVGILGRDRTATFNEYRTFELEEELARESIRLHGRTAADFFKIWPDKSYFFSKSRQSFISYGLAGKFAIVLGDPVGPVDELRAIVADFLGMCSERGWRAVFHQATPEYLSMYSSMGFRRFKVGEDAIVDLKKFSLDGKEAKKLRYKINHFEKQGIHAEVFEPPIAAEVLEQAREISGEWLQIARRRERGFTLGTFADDYVRSHPIFAAMDSNGRMLAFANVIPSHCPGETTVDLMRYRTSVEGPIMDYLLIKLFALKKQEGYERFSLGMAPMCGFQENEEHSFAEQALHRVFGRLNFLFSYSGLRQHKAKFADDWEPRYLLYRSTLDLARFPLAISRLAEIPEGAGR